MKLNEKYEQRIKEKEENKKIMDKQRIIGWRWRTRIERVYRKLYL